MNTNDSCTPEATTGKTTAAQITDKRGYGKRWQFSLRHIDNLIAQGLPHLKIGSRRVRILVEEADAWMRERFGTQKRGPFKSPESISAKAEKGASQ